MNVLQKQRTERRIIRIAYRISNYVYVVYMYPDLYARVNTRLGRYNSQLRRV